MYSGDINIKNTQSANIFIGTNPSNPVNYTNSIVLDASCIIDTSGNNSFFVSPIRSGITGPNVLYYGADKDYEITYGPKSFIIDHPLDKNKYLVHACLEGPEAGVYYRGSVNIIDENLLEAEVVLADYVKVFAYDYTVHVTPIITCKKLIPIVAASSVIDGKFNIFTNSVCKVDYIVFGKRQSFEIEPDKNSVNVKGDGPYKYI